MNRDYYNPSDDSDSTQKVKFDPATKRFADILSASAEMSENDYNYVPESTTIAIVASFPDKNAEVVRLYTSDYDNVRLALDLLGKLSKSSVHLKTPYGGF